MFARDSSHGITADERAPVADEAVHGVGLDR